MKRKKFITEQGRVKAINDRQQKIIEAFQRTFDKIKRVNEGWGEEQEYDSPEYQGQEDFYDQMNQNSKEGLEEIDYNDVYSKTNPNDKQQMKIDDYPALGKNLEHWLNVADTALNSSDWKAKESARHRFLMDDNELQEYYGKLVKIKSAIDKSKNGEPLDDFEKRIARYYKTDKGNQNSRINKMAKDKIGGDYMKNHDGTVTGDKTFSGIDRNSNEPVNIEIVGNTTVANDHGDMFINYPVSIDGAPGKLKVYADSSHGFELDSGKFINIRFTDRPDFINTDAKKLQNVYPKKNK